MGQDRTPWPPLLALEPVQFVNSKSTTSLAPRTLAANGDVTLTPPPIRTGRPLSGDGLPRNPTSKTSRHLRGTEYTLWRPCSFGVSACRWVLGVDAVLSWRRSCGDSELRAYAKRWPCVPKFLEGCLAGPLVGARAALSAGPAPARCGAQNPRPRASCPVCRTDGESKIVLDDTWVC